MKITFRDILNSINAFRELQELKFPPKLALDVYKLSKQLDVELETYKDLSGAIYRSHNIPEMESGFDLSNVTQDTFTVLANELDELLDTELEINFTPISLEVLERTGGAVSTNMLIALSWLFDGLKDEVKEEPKAIKPKGKREAVATAGE